MDLYSVALNSAGFATGALASTATATAFGISTMVVLQIVSPFPAITAAAVSTGLMANVISMLPHTPFIAGVHVGSRATALTLTTGLNASFTISEAEGRRKINISTKERMGVALTSCMTGIFAGAMAALYPVPAGVEIAIGTAVSGLTSYAMTSLLQRRTLMSTIRRIT